MTSEQYEIIFQCIGRAKAIEANTTDETAKNVAADIAERLISLTSESK